MCPISSKVNSSCRKWRTSSARASERASFFSYFLKESITDARMAAQSMAGRRAERLFPAICHSHSSWREEKAASRPSVRMRLSSCRCSFSQRSTTADGTWFTSSLFSRRSERISSVTMSFAMATILSRLLEMRLVRKGTPRGFLKREVTPNQSAKPPTEAAKDR